ncbi:MAG: tyrosine-type recombinase/integrase [Paraglaciecola sp.]|nr:tyrosine-type recombinase/integrase [Paraglaciecola sp.]
MTKKTRPLSDTEIKNAKPKNKIYALYDNNGLQLRISPSGSKTWLFRYRRPVVLKTNNIKLGTYPALKLAAARKLTLTYREKLAIGIDPQKWLEEQKYIKQIEINNTLEKLARQWFKIKFSKITPRYAFNIERTFEMYVFPKLGSYPVTELNSPLIIKHLKPLEAAGKLETLSRICQRINELMLWCVNTGALPSNTLTSVKAAFISPNNESMPTLKPEQLPELMRRISQAQIKLQTRYLIEFQLHTMVRPSEAAGARWNEIDLTKNEWKIPASRMKQKCEHIVPLSPQVTKLLEALNKISGHTPFVFPSTRHNTSHINSETVNRALQRMGYKGILVSHGFRALASTTLNEQAFNADVIEKALSHCEGNAVRAAYNRAEYLEQRRSLLNWWSNHIENACMGSVAL